MTDMHDATASTELPSRLRVRRAALALIAGAALVSLATGARADDAPAAPLYRLSFGPAAPAAGFTAVGPGTTYSKEKGYGFEPGAEADGDKPFYFSVAVPEGNYKVTVTLGDPKDESDTTVKAELRRLMLEDVHTAPGQFETRSFIVNVRTPAIATGGAVHLKSPRETTTEAWAWDDKLTLEFNGRRPRLTAVEVGKADVPTIYILGDSTVCDQSKEPYASWGQMLPRFFKPDVAVANHAESGETLASSTAAHRFDKVMSLIKPGDYLLIQYGHNDMKSKSPDAPQQYKATLEKWAGQVKQKGATPVLITPMNRHSFQGDTVTNSLREYPEMVREAAKELNVPLIDLNAMSKTLYKALGPQPSIQLFEHNADLSKFDGTHHSPYGAYELAKCVIEGIRQDKLDLASHIANDVPTFDPAKPDPVEQFKVPPSPGVTNQRPLGD